MNLTQMTIIFTTVGKNPLEETPKSTQDETHFPLICSIAIRVPQNTLQVA